MRLKDRVAVVTGAARGIGLEIARRLAAEGAWVALADLDDAAERLCTWPEELRGRARTRCTDVRDAGQVRALMDAVVSDWGRLDVLVNNASVFTALERKSFLELDEADWERSLSVNVLGTFQCIKAAHPHLVRSGRGKVVNVASDAVFKGLPQLLDYVASKGAVVAMTRSLARELGRDGVCINAVAPGLTHHDDYAAWDPERNRRVVAARCLQRTQTPEDVAGAVVFLASDESDFVTGQTLVVDGGEVLH